MVKILLKVPLSNMQDFDTSSTIHELCKTQIFLSDSKTK